MKKLLFTLLILLVSTGVYSQIKAITETGDEVLLFDDGSWSYSSEKVSDALEISVNNELFTKSQKSTFNVKSNKTDIGIWINPKEWSFTKNADNEAAEFQFQKKDEDLYALLIAERAEIPLENLRSIAIQNAKSAAPDLKIIREEYRVVNGNKVLMMQMSGTVQGIKFVYYGYYYTYENGSVQFLAYTALNLFDIYAKDMEILLNGFDRIK